MKLLLATFGVGFVSALFPLVNMETYVVGIGIDVGAFGVWTLAITAAAGQTLGKAIWYELGRRSMHWGFIQRKMDKPTWKQRYANVKNRIDDRAWVGMLLLFASAVTGFPPLVIMSVLAGQLEFNRMWFYAVTFVGRSLRFGAVLGGVSLLTNSSLFH